jgi:hypothetical protein
MIIQSKELILKSGDKVLWEYDQEGDLLEMTFQAKEATGAVELTDNMILRFDWDRNEPLSLSIMSASHIMQPGQYGEAHFELLTAEWPAEVHDKIISMLKSPPLNEFLKLGSYTPAHTQRLIPLTSLQPATQVLELA